MDRPDVRWHRGVASEDALREHLDSPDAIIGRHCPACGSGAHGRPWARLPDGSSPHVSLSHCGEHLVTAVAEHPVGVDVESVAAVGARWDPALVLHPTETPHLPRQMREWAHLPRCNWA